MTPAPGAIPWVLLRGLARERAHWGDFAGRLRAALPAHPAVVMLDLPGCGEKHDERSPARIDAIADACRAQLRELGIAPPVVLLALSLGAMVASDWAQRHPRELAGAVLVNTSLRPINPWHRRLRPSAWPTLVRIAAAGRDPVVRERAVLALTSARPAAHVQRLDAWTQVRRERPVRWRDALRQLAAASRHRAPDIPPQVPLLLLAGARDRLVDPRCSRDIAARWNAAFAQHPDAGHDLPLDEPEWVATTAAAWWSSLRAAAPR